MGNEHVKYNAILVWVALALITFGMYISVEPTLELLLTGSQKDLIPSMATHMYGVYISYVIIIGACVWTHLFNFEKVWDASAKAARNIMMYLVPMLGTLIIGLSVYIGGLLGLTSVLAICLVDILIVGTTVYVLINTWSALTPAALTTVVLSSAALAALLMSATFTVAGPGVLT